MKFEVKSIRNKSMVGLVRPDQFQHVDTGVIIKKKKNYCDPFFYFNYMATYFMGAFKY